MADEPTIQPPVAPVEVPESPVTAAPPTEESPATPPPPVAETLETPQRAEEARRTRFQRRIDDLTRQKGDAQRDAEYWKSRAEGRPAADAQTTQPVEPRAESFATTEDYVKAVAKWEVQQAQAQAAQDERTRREAQNTQEALTRFEPQLEKARAKYADFDEVTSAPLYGPQTQELLFASPHGADIAYYLGTHPQEADKINRMNTGEAARTIVKLESRFEAPPPKSVSSAPAPITPVTGTVAPATDPEKMTTAEWMDWNKQQQLERYKARPLV